MKQKCLILIFLSIAGFIPLCYGQKVLNLGIGPVWPREVRDTEKPTAWNATIEYGRVFDQRIGLGIDIDFLWNKTEKTKDTTKIEGGKEIKEKILLEEQKRYMLPISLFLYFDPVPQIVVHPIIRGQVGFNMMIYNNVDYREGKNKTKDSGFYIGVIGKVAIEALYDIGEHVSIFAGFVYQLGKLRKRKNGIFYEREIFGPGIRMGISFLF